MQNCSRSTKLLLLAIVLLAVLVAVLALLNAQSTKEKLALQSDAEFVIRANGQELARVTMEDLAALTPEDYNAVLDTSAAEPTDVTFTAVPLERILRAKGIDPAQYETFTATALDGYASAYTQAEVLAKDDVLVCFASGGELLKPKAEGGKGPYLVVIRSAKFSQRWCKFLAGFDLS